MRFSLVIFLLSAMGCLAAPPERSAINGRRSETNIQKTLLDNTPIGSKAADVRLFLNQQLKHEGGSVPSVGNREPWHLVATGKKKEGNFEFESIPDLTPCFAEEWIGSNFDLEIILSIYQGFPFKMWVSATWRFGSDGLLKTIIVKKTADGP